MLERLQEFLAKNPSDSFVRYGLAMELAKLGRAEEAIAHFHTLMTGDPDYVAAYLQAGMALVRAGRRDEARDVFRRGIAAAERKANSHAAGELAGALAQLQNEG
jgi:Flp pilus assembly protein TadD